MAVVLNKNTIEADNTILSLGLYSYACFTALAVEHGKVKGFDYHMERLVNDSTEIFGVKPQESDIKDNIRAFLNELGSVDHIIVRVTIFPDNFSLATPENIDSLNILVTGRAHSSVSGKPMKLSCVDATRVLPYQKTTNMISNLKARAIAHNTGFDDALMTQDGILTEGATWNIFFGKDNKLTTPPLSSGILPGITRKLIIEYSSRFGFDVEERVIRQPELSEFSYSFATNAAIGIAAVASIDTAKFDSQHAGLSELKNKYENIEGESV